MPRKKRNYLPGYPYHIVQRENNREACFAEPENYRYYLELWKDNAKRYGVSVHAYCLMTNHVHFLATPEHADSLSRATSVIGSRCAWYFNRKYMRTGTIWEGRHKASLVQSERYFLTCCRYIEMNPVVAGKVRKAEEYRWSSYRVNAWGAHSRLTPHEEYLNLGANAEERCHAYRELFRYQIPDEDVHLIERASQYCHPVGDERFKQQIEQKFGIRLGQAARGRPAKKQKVVKE